MDTLQFAVPQSFFELLLQVFGTIFSILMCIGLKWLNSYLKRKANIVLFENEEQMRQRLFVAINNGINSAIEKVDAKELDARHATIAEKTLTYVKETVPGTVKGLKANDAALATVIASQVAQIATKNVFEKVVKDSDPKETETKLDAIVQK